MAKIAKKVGAGVLAAGAAAAVGYYFYGSKDAKKHRKIAVTWAGAMKKDVMREAKRLEKVSEKDFAKVVDSVSGTYRDARAVNPADLKRAARELKANWKMVQREMRGTGKKAISRGTKTVKKMVKKARAGR